MSEDKVKEAPKKTEAELLEEKKKLFAEDPERFVDIKELLLSAKRSPEGIMFLINSEAKDQELIVALYNLDQSVHDHFAYKKMMRLKDQADNSRIISPHKKKGGMFGGRRR